MNSGSLQFWMTSFRHCALWPPRQSFWIVPFVVGHRWTWHPQMDPKKTLFGTFLLIWNFPFCITLLFVLYYTRNRETVSHVRGMRLCCETHTCACHHICYDINISNIFLIQLCEYPIRYNHCRHWCDLHCCLSLVQSNILIFVTFAWMWSYFFVACALPSCFSSLSITVNACLLGCFPLPLLQDMTSAIHVSFSLFCLVTQQGARDSPTFSSLPLPASASFWRFWATRAAPAERWLRFSRRGSSTPFRHGRLAGQYFTNRMAPPAACIFKKAFCFKTWWSRLPLGLKYYRSV